MNPRSLCWEVNFTLIPEVPFELQGEYGFLNALHKRLAERRHAVVVVAEGAGQHLIDGSDLGHDPSGNPRMKDIGPFLKDSIERFMAERTFPVTVKYFDPSYIVRSRPANKDDALLCDQFARNAVHAAMAGTTDIVIGLWYNVFVHVPIPMATASKRRVLPDGEASSAVLAATGQAPEFRNSLGAAEQPG